MSEVQAHAWAIRMQAAGWRKQRDGSWKRGGLFSAHMPKTTAAYYRAENRIPAPLFGAKEAGQ
jgi:hypothetical protein